ncbi:MAG TPA: hypothetical protein ENK27_03125 [Desulfobulbus sp.]|nr:hypothetical protein [Desulfobulbus sp.]
MDGHLPDNLFNFSRFSPVEAGNPEKPAVQCSAIPVKKSPMPSSRTGLPASKHPQSLRDIPAPAFMAMNVCIQHYIPVMFLQGSGKVAVIE